jgi:site-specific DNA-methyltransferase (adenine-specific)
MATRKKNSETLEVSGTCADAVAWLRSLPSSSADLIITDPPYESMEKHRSKGTTTRLSVSKGSSNLWFDVFPNSRFPELFAECFRVLKNNSHFYLFCDASTMLEVIDVARAAGFTFWKPLVWDKVQIGMGYHYRARYEFILFFEKGKRKLNDLSVADVLVAKRVRNGYPTEKPESIVATLVRQSSQPGERVMDPFMGSGVVGVEALRAGRGFWGNDVNAESVTGAVLRMRRAAEMLVPPIKPAGLYPVEGEKHAEK